MIDPSYWQWTVRILMSLQPRYSTIGGVFNYVRAEPYGVVAILLIGFLAYFATVFMMQYVQTVPKYPTKPLPHMKVPQCRINSLVIIYLLYRIWELEHKVQVLAQAQDVEPESP